MNPFLFYLLADRLMNDAASGPAEFRSAISRAYYAAYHSARDFLKELGVDSPKGPAGHGKIPIALLAITETDIAQAGRLLDDLKGEQNKADYALSDPLYNRRPTAEDILLKVSQVLASLKGCLGSPTRKQQAETEIKNWVQSGVGKTLGFAIV
jgi:hypothetical protein